MRSRQREPNERSGMLSFETAKLGSSKLGSTVHMGTHGALYYGDMAPRQHRCGCHGFRGRDSGDANAPPGGRMILVDLA